MKNGSRKPMLVKLQNYISVPFCGCHIWLGSTDKDGYGTIRRPGGAHLKAHRESFREYVGDPGDKHVLHKCDIPPCINPEHLYLGDPAMNGLDKMLRGRARTTPQIGTANPMAKLTEELVKEIRQRCDAGELQRSVAVTYGIRQSTVSKIVNNQRWNF